jgi:hypothetical protein
LLFVTSFNHICIIFIAYFTSYFRSRKKEKAVTDTGGTKLDKTTIRVANYAKKEVSFMRKSTSHSTWSFEKSLNKINYLILTVTFAFWSIPIFDGFRSYLSNMKNKVWNIKNSCLCFTYTVNDTSWMDKLNDSKIQRNVVVDECRESNWGFLPLNLEEANRWLV